MKIGYVAKGFTPEHMTVINRANEILTKYGDQGFVLTLRQLYYRFVVAGYIKNELRSYKRLGGIVADARLAGLMDWDMIEDRTRWLAELEHFEHEQQVFDKAWQEFEMDMWVNQPYRPEVWIEKDALVGMIKPVCQEHDVPYFSCRGYTSLSEMWRASLRLRRHAVNGQTPYIIHFGDHDPSGIDMSRDIEHRLRSTFMTDFKFHRVALMLSQIEELRPPPNPAKISDSRYQAYVAKYGDESWELDALEPDMFRSTIVNELAKLRDVKKWQKMVKIRDGKKTQIKKVALSWENYETSLKKYQEAEWASRDKITDLAEQNAELREKLAAESDRIRKMVARAKSKRRKKK